MAETGFYRGTYAEGEAEGVKRGRILGLKQAARMGHRNHDWADSCIYLIREIERKTRKLEREKKDD
jgi:hypothetical protein